jgi:hypothetical protein
MTQRAFGSQRQGERFMTKRFKQVHFLITFE